MSAAPLLDVHGLSCRYVPGAAAAVEGVSFELAEGELLALVGPSGCGKSTTLRAVAGLEPVEGGTIVLRGRTLSGGEVAVPPEARGVGLVFQELALFPHLTALQNVAFGLPHLPAMAREERARALLEMVSLQGFEARRPGELSGGQQQRVAVARALAPSPPLLLLDEPFSSLDVSLREGLRRDVRALLRQLGTAAILVTHDRDEVFAFADRVAVMHAGKLEQVGQPEAVYAAPRTAFVAALMGDCALVPARADGALAACALGQVALAAPAQGEVRMVVRPESLTVLPSGDVSRGVPATVLARRFRGSTTTLELAVGDVVVWAQMPGPSPHAEGASVRVAAVGPLAAVA